MKTLHFAGALALAPAAAAWGGNGTPAQQDQHSPGADAGTPANPDQPTYSAAGRVTAVAPVMVQGISVRDRVDFAFREADGGAYASISLSTAR